MLEELFEHFVDANSTGAERLIQRPWEPDWASPSEVGGVDTAGRINWRPTRNEPPADFSGLENALGIPIHGDIRTFFGSWWADHVPVVACGLDCELLFLWNKADLEMLQANLIGHALEKRRVREPLTVFFACVDDHRFFSVDNDSGMIMLETLGRHGPEPAAETLAEFLEQAQCREYRPSQSRPDEGT